MTKKWLKRIGLTVLLAPIILVLLTIILLYIPPIQNYIRKEATAYASQATGMQINVQRINLRFPLKLAVSGVEVVQAPDTILTLESLSASVQLLPLFQGRAELDDVTLRGAKVNTANLIEGMQLSGVLGRFSLQSHGVDLSNEIALINNVELRDTHLHLLLNDTTESPKDTTQSTLNWKASLLKAKLQNVSFSMQMPADTMRVAAHIGEAAINNVEADLGKQFYGLEQLLISGTSVNYDTGTLPPAKGFDPSHMALRDIRVGIDSVSYRAMNMHAVIREFSMNERSGLSIESLTGSLHMDSLQIRVPGLKLLTPHSELNLHAQAYWDMTSLEDDRVIAGMDGRIGKQDVLLFAAALPDAFKKSYPAHPLTMQLSAKGNMNRIDISRLSMNLPSAFTLTGGGTVEQVLDSINRTGNVELQLRTQNLNFLTALAGLPNDGSIVIPPNIVMALKAGMRGPQYNATLRARESAGTLHLDAGYNLNTEAYTANLKIDSLAVNHFLPKDSIYTLAATANLKGQGTDFTSYRTSATVAARVDKLEYASYNITNIHLDGALKNAIASAHIVSNNPLLAMDGQAEYALNKPYTQAKAHINVAHLNLHELGFIPDTLKKPLALDLNANLGKDTVNIALNSGDLKFRLRSRGPLETLLKESTGFVDILNKQIEAKRLDHAELRRALPSAGLVLTSGTDNPLYQYLASFQNIKYTNLNVGFVATPRIGINGRAAIHALKIDTLQLDTVYFSIKQDTSLMALRSGVINGPKNPHFVFNTSLTGEVRSEDAELTLKFNDGQGETGVLLGVNIRPEEDGMLFKLIPEEPTVAFRKFNFNGHNTVFVRDNFRVLADVEMLDSIGMGLRVKSLEEADSTYLQNLDIEIRAVELAEVSKILPYLPDISGLVFLEANYKQSAESMQVSAEGIISKLHYETNRVGNLGLGVTWLPDNKGKHFLNAYMTSEGTEVLTADGTYNTVGDVIDVTTSLEHFPLYITNAFIPDQLVELMGDLDGSMAITGTPDKPAVDGELMLDSVTVTSWQYGFDFRFDNRPMQIQNSRLTFDKFAIYTTSDNPFTINGYVDVADLSKPMVSLALDAKNYQLLNAKRKNDSMLYGRVFLDLNSTIKGPVSNLVMRGNVNLLNNTDVTYVMVDSPLSVQDRLGDLVEFTSFSDTIVVEAEEQPQLALGGMDIIMNIHIDQTAKVNVDLSPDRSSRIALQGGGDLAFQYTPQGEMLLSGRYTLFGGTVKYALPVIPLKEFAVNNGSYVEWGGDVMDPNLNFKATERMRVSVPNEGSNGSRMVNFDISIEVKNKLNDLELLFNLEAPDDAEVQRQLAAMDAAERSKQAITLMATGMYQLTSGSSGGDFSGLVQSQIANLVGKGLKHADITFGMDSYDGADGKRTDYNFSYSKRFFNDRVQVVIGGTVSSGQTTDEEDVFIDNVSLEYRLDTSGTRYVRLFHNKEYENILESDITETGGGIILRKKVNKLGELFIFKKKKK
ncbi:translocation/assembly module TamB domain-containing protein [Bacteroides sp. 51]|uniref:translocation/assembly module TamB domain-containing protein n=1 Tax=Bacteroides sp. 51 TaxID=2302938 RepID=UPI0013D8B1B3|nr:translocation/assembly module TamB domain-containing protein [Bacteroides sp. 51]NDV83775.1 translocation/assembly module TamB [Bacteroides sp. 51]